ncbi:hypothetical protein DL89DRAFT_266882 [Linderina pennispora]|uniref:Uncharacterized protein n=1 Tax=Linderina pennispora TaxID=61395 RepID=A0A1Y1WB16_9FUNG|nr:uncharacterized protein DL89DRAFT_266882 [Linderina pennispora]ORX70727.1 hypothetical protein DL89DRAFT_266882 [Linderina pennispora]
MLADSPRNRLATYLHSRQAPISGNSTQPDRALKPWGQPVPLDRVRNDTFDDMRRNVVHSGATRLHV